MRDECVLTVTDCLYPCHMPEARCKDRSAPSDAAILERASSMANRALWTARLQRRRLSCTEPEDNEFLFRFWADLEFLILALWHIRLAALLARRVAGVRVTIQAAIEQFDTALPGLRTMRNVIEHLDEYGVDIGRQQDISRKQLQVGAWDGVAFRWLGIELNVDDAVAAGKALYLTVYRAKSSRELIAAARGAKEEPRPGDR